MVATFGLELAYGSEIRGITSLFYVLGLVAFVRYGGILRTGMPGILLVWAVAVSLISWGAMKVTQPDFPGNEYRLEGVLDKFVFIIPALILAGSARNILSVWLVVSAAVLAHSWTAGAGWEEFAIAFEGVRSGFGSNPIRMGMIWGTVFLGCLAFCYRFVVWNGFSWPRLLPWLVLTLISGFCTLATQSRGVYLSLLVVAFCGVIAAVWIAYRKGLFAYLKLWHYVAAAMLLVVLGGYLAQSGQVQGVLDRTESQWIAVEQFAEGEVEDVTRNSIGLRIHFWVEAADWIAERPLLGWGFRASWVLHEEAGNRFEDRYFHTIHNAFIDVLLSYGIIGFALFSTLAIWLIRGGLAAVRSGVMPVDFAVFFAAFTVFYAVNSVFTSSLFIKDSIYLFNVVLAGWASFIFKDAVLKAERQAGTVKEQE